MCFLLDFLQQPLQFRLINNRRRIDRPVPVIVGQNHVGELGLSGDCLAPGDIDESVRSFGPVYLGLFLFPVQPFVLPNVLNPSVLDGLTKGFLFLCLLLDPFTKDSQLCPPLFTRLFQVFLFANIGEVVVKAPIVHLPHFVFGVGRHQ
ncbi:MAG: hypothetical protein IH612_19150 [Desulfofustis sp.]|nr:hypothetical protein [Desulfofustis sp.]